MKFLIAGLGNPGEKYANTRHNAGYLVLDAFVQKHTATFDLARHGETAIVKYKGKTLVCLKPSTFMNLSGKALNYWMQAENISLDNVLVVTDDIALPFGSLRLKGKGTDGGHKGLKDIITTLNTTEFSRLRFGVGSEFSKGRQVDYVLGNWSDEENKLLKERVELGVQIIESFVTAGLARTMNDYNKR